MSSVNKLTHLFNAGMLTDKHPAHMTQEGYYVQAFNISLAGYCAPTGDIYEGIVQNSLGTELKFQIDKEPIIVKEYNGINYILSERGGEYELGSIPSVEVEEKEVPGSGGSFVVTQDDNHLVEGQKYYAMVRWDLNSMPYKDDGSYYKIIMGNVHASSGYDSIHFSNFLDKDGNRMHFSLKYGETMIVYGADTSSMYGITNGIAWGIEYLQVQTYEWQGDLEIIKVGKLVDVYSPLNNLVDDRPFITTKLNIQRTKYLDMKFQPVFDGSVNIIINDGETYPISINSGFNQDGPIPTIRYNPSSYKFAESIRLSSVTTDIVGLQFKGTAVGGVLKGGGYYYYFRYKDASGNTSSIIERSRLVNVFHRESEGTPDYPGAETGNWSYGTRKDKKSYYKTSFELTNLSSDVYSFIEVWYEYHGHGDSDEVNTYKILRDFPIDGDRCKIVHTGNEPVEAVESEAVALNPVVIDSAKSIDVEDSRLFIAGTRISANENIDRLKAFALNNITVKGEVTTSNADKHSNNAENVYSHTMYHLGEYYCGGIVFTLKDSGQETAVFPIKGLIDKGNFTTPWGSNVVGTLPDTWRTTDSGDYENDIGVTVIPAGDSDDFAQKLLGNRAGRLKFSLNNMSQIEDIVSGYYFVRAKRNFSDRIIHSQGFYTSCMATNLAMSEGRMDNPQQSWRHNNELKLTTNTKHLKDDNERVGVDRGFASTRADSYKKTLDANVGLDVHKYRALEGAFNNLFGRFTDSVVITGRGLDALGNEISQHELEEDSNLQVTPAPGEQYTILANYSVNVDGSSDLETPSGVRKQPMMAKLSDRFIARKRVAFYSPDMVAGYVPYQDTLPLEAKVATFKEVASNVYKTSKNTLGSGYAYQDRVISISRRSSASDPSLSFRDAELRLINEKHTGLARPNNFSSVCGGVNLIGFQGWESFGDTENGGWDVGIGKHHPNLTIVSQEYSPYVGMYSPKVNWPRYKVNHTMAAPTNDEIWGAFRTGMCMEASSDLNILTFSSSTQGTYKTFASGEDQSNSYNNGMYALIQGSLGRSTSLAADLYPDFDSRQFRAISERHIVTSASSRTHTVATGGDRFFGDTTIKVLKADNTERFNGMLHDRLKIAGESKALMYLRMLEVPSYANPYSRTIKELEDSGIEKSFWPLSPAEDDGPAAYVEDYDASSGMSEEPVDFRTSVGQQAHASVAARQASTIYYTEKADTVTYTNRWREIHENNKETYMTNNGDIEKIIAWNQGIMVLKRDGIEYLQVSREVTNDNVLLGTLGVLPKRPRDLSNIIGCRHPHSVIQVPQGIMGIDSVRAVIFLAAEDVRPISKGRIQTTLDGLLREVRNTDYDFVANAIRGYYDEAHNKVRFSITAGDQMNLTYLPDYNIIESLHDYMPDHEFLIKGDLHSFKNSNAWLHTHNAPRNFVYGEQLPTSIQFIVVGDETEEKILDLLNVYGSKHKPSKVIYELTSDDYVDIQYPTNDYGKVVRVEQLLTTRSESGIIMANYEYTGNVNKIICDKINELRKMHRRIQGLWIKVTLIYDTPEYLYISRVESETRKSFT